MRKIIVRPLLSTIVAAILATVSFPVAASEPIGLWYDHTGRGAIEITQCGSNICGRLVWLKDAKHSDVCGTQIIGNAKPAGGGKWDGGWIYDPDRAARYSVEITSLGGDRLKVMGYQGTKFLSETHIWRRAPSGLKRCGA